MTTIYFADLTHDTIGLATEVFPLNIGLVAAYARKRFGDDLSIRLFKYIPDLEDAIDRAPPDILALSNYPWCHNVNMAMLRSLAERRPEALRIMGGPNFPHGPRDQERFLAERQLVDAYVYLDGEIGFSNIVERLHHSGNLKAARLSLGDETVPGCVQVDGRGRLLATVEPVRLTNLDEIPSPYLTGLMNPFFDGRLSPMIQTNRGCPFKCTFCHDGSEKVNKVVKFSIERTVAEIKYIAERVPENINALFISDLNFGMYKRDAEICAELAYAQKEFGFPSYINTTTGKNSKERIISAIEQLGGALSLTMSVQSLTTSVLENIKRDNIKVEDFLELKPTITKAKLPTISEVILGLPGETKESHFESLGRLLDMEMDSVVSYTMMLLNGSELATDDQRRKWGYKTKYRVLPRDFTKLKNGENIIEVEEVVVASDTLSFNDYLECRQMALLVNVTNNLGFRPLLKFLIQHGVSIMGVLVSMLDEMINATKSSSLQGDQPDPALVRLFSEFARETKEELWASADDLTAFFADDGNFQRLVEGVYGANLIQTYRARLYAHCFADVADLFFRVARNYLGEKGGSEEFKDVESFCRGRIYNLFGADRKSNGTEAILLHDVEGWLSDPEGRGLHKYRLPAPRRVRFIITDNQFRIVEDALGNFGSNDLGIGKTINRIGLNTLWRRAVMDEVA